jgi:hypothetical protein
LGCRRCGRWLESLEGDLKGVDELAGAAGIDGVLGEAVNDGGEGDEDGGAVLDRGQLHAGDLGIDEDAAVGAVGLLDVVVVAIIFILECGRAATLAGRGLVVMALLVASEVWQWLRHGYPPGYRFLHDLPNKPLSSQLFCRILETKDLVCKIF